MSEMCHGDTATLSVDLHGDETGTRLPSHDGWPRLPASAGRRSSTSWSWLPESVKVIRSSRLILACPLLAQCVFRRRRGNRTNGYSPSRLLIFLDLAS